MGWTKITYFCGHTGREQMYGPHRQREFRAELLGRRLCPGCFVEKRTADNAAKAAAIAAEAPGLPELEGSERQINWAGALRADAVTVLRTLAGKVEGQDGALELIGEILMRRSAAFWIDRRGDFETEFRAGLYVRAQLTARAAEAAGKAALCI